MQLIISIAIKPYLKKYLAKDFPVEPFVIDRMNAYSLFLYNCLESYRQLSAEVEKPYQIDKKIFRSELKTAIGEMYWNTKGDSISEANQFFFNKFVSYNFNEELYRYLRMRITTKGSLNKAIFGFLEYYELSEDDLALKTVQKIYERRHKRLSA